MSLSKSPKRYKACESGPACLKSYVDGSSKSVEQLKGYLFSEKDPHPKCGPCTINDAEGYHFGGEHKVPLGSPEGDDCVHCRHLKGPCFRDRRASGCYYRFVMHFTGFGEWVAGKTAFDLLREEGAKYVLPEKTSLLELYQNGFPAEKPVLKVVSESDRPKMVMSQDGSYVHESDGNGNSINESLSYANESEQTYKSESPLQSAQLSRRDGSTSSPRGDEDNDPELVVLEDGTYGIAIENSLDNPLQGESSQDAQSQVHLFNQDQGGTPGGQDQVFDQQPLTTSTPVIKTEATDASGVSFTALDQGGNRSLRGLTSAGVLPSPGGTVVSRHNQQSLDMSDKPRGPLVGLRGTPDNLGGTEVPQGKSELLCGPPVGPQGSVLPRGSLGEPRVPPESTQGLHVEKVGSKQPRGPPKGPHGVGLLSKPLRGSSSRPGDLFHPPGQGRLPHGYPKPRALASSAAGGPDSRIPAKASTVKQQPPPVMGYGGASQLRASSTLIGQRAYTIAADYMRRHGQSPKEWNVPYDAELPATAPAEYPSVQFRPPPPPTRAVETDLRGHKQSPVGHVKPRMASKASGIKTVTIGRGEDTRNKGSDGLRLPEVDLNKVKPEPQSPGQTVLSNQSRQPTPDDSTATVADNQGGG